jgi:hypothetical protein
MGYDSKGILVFNLKYEHAISFINLVKFINYYQMPRSISSKLFVIASGGGEANVYGSSYYWNFRTSSFKQVACLILANSQLIRNIHWPSSNTLIFDECTILCDQLQANNITNTLIFSFDKIICQCVFSFTFNTWLLPGLNDFIICFPFNTKLWKLINA